MDGKCMAYDIHEYADGLYGRLLFILLTLKRGIDDGQAYTGDRRGKKRQELLC